MSDRSSASVSGTAIRAERRELRRLGYHTTSLVRCAARYARLTGSSICEAAAIFRVNAGGVWNAWARIYPLRAQPFRARRTCTACAGEGHIAVDGACSPSERARRLVDGGSSVIEAAAQTGVTASTVYQAIDRRKRAA